MSGWLGSRLRDPGAQARDPGSRRRNPSHPNDQNLQKDDVQPLSTKVWRHVRGTPEFQAPHPSQDQGRHRRRPWSKEGDLAKALSIGRPG